MSETALVFGLWVHSEFSNHHAEQRALCPPRRLWRACRVDGPECGNPRSWRHGATRDEAVAAVLRSCGVVSP